MRKNQVLRFTRFREQFKYDYYEIEEKDGCKYWNGELVEDEEKKYAEGEKFLNIGYNFKLSNAKVLSNLYPLSFKFRGKWVASIEGVLQGVKYKDKKTQNKVLKYSGLDAYHTRCANSLGFWGNDGVLYWQGKLMKRDSIDYQLFLDELYISAIKNPLYRSFLLATGDKILIHHIGNTDIFQTVLTRFEYELRLNALREWIKSN